MQRYCAEYIIKVKVSDIMITSDETEIEVKEKIKKIGQENIKKWINGVIYDPEGLVFAEDIKIIDKGL
jgi:radical SAM superfamily enzyme YgiQ (UPF0313 family)